MNYDPSSSPFNMPELRWKWGYPAALLFMFALGVTMLVLFRRRGWLGAPKEGPAANERPFPPADPPGDRR
jgi:magnesium transporter